MLTLHGYWRSSASYRVRIALHLKNLEFRYEAVHLVKNGGEQKSDAYRQLNPAQLVPTLTDGPLSLNQSLAIIEYLDSLAEPLLVPKDPAAAATVRMLAYDLACDLQPITNLRILKYLSGELNVTDQQRTDWIHHWIAQTFNGFEERMKRYAGDYCVGDSITLADLCLVPQVYNAQRFGADLTPYPMLMAVHDRLQEHPAFQKARPEAQPDAEG